MKLFYRSYDPVIKWSYDHKNVIFSMAIASLIFTGIIFSRMGGEFVPTLDEGDFVIQPVLKTGTSLSKTIELTTQMENILIEEFPEVDQIVCRIGAAEVPTDPMSMEEIDMIIKLRPKKEWISADSKEELADQFKEALLVIPGIDYEFTQPIEMRFNELITGVRADLAIKIFGDDLDILSEKAIEVKKLITGLPGAADIILEKTAGLPQMSVKYKRNKVAYHGLSIETLNNYLTTAFGGGIAGSVFEGEQRFDLVTRFQPEYRNDIENIRNMYIGLPNGEQIPLHELADIEYSTGPAKISRDNTHRRVVVSVNVRNRDLESVVTDIEGILDEQLDLPPGYYIDYGGQFENLRNATRRLKIAVPIALLLIFIFLHFAFGSFKEAGLVFTAIPLSVVGGVFFLWIRGMPFSISAGIGFIALFGIAVLNGIVLIEHLKELKKQGVSDMRERVLRGTRERLRPVLLTASAAALGFLPMAISHSAGAEVQRPLATVVIGGLVTSTLLTMLALPLMYAIIDDITGIQLWPPKFKRRKIVPIILLLLLPAVAFPQNQPEQKAPITLTLSDALELAFENNKELAAYRSMMDESDALIKTAFAIDKTQLYYNYDENNIAENNYPIGVIGGEQRFDFPTLYFAQRNANRITSQMAKDEMEKKKRLLTKNVSKSYYTLVYLQNKQKLYELVDSIYSRFSDAAKMSYEAGNVAYLEMLNAQSKQNQAHILMNQVQHEMDIAMAGLSALIYFDSLFVIPVEPLTELIIKPENAESDPGYQYLLHNMQQKEAAIKVEKNKLLPDVTLGYFNGTNRYSGAANYQGFEVGVGIPLFFSEQRAKAKAGRFAMEAADYLKEDYLRQYQDKVGEMMTNLKKYREGIRYFERSGKHLSEEMIRAAKLSYEAGEIDFFRWVQSIDTAVEIELNYLDNLFKYNNIVLEINHLTL